jgi:ATP-dependent Clp protease ATP-binding subunit ClpA
MTSNVGSSTIRDSVPIGFSVNTADKRNQTMRQKLMDALRSTFRPEFLNRVDDIIVFNPLSREHLDDIIAIQLERVSELLEQRGIKLNLTENARQVLIAEGYDPQYGARPLRRAIQRMIQDPLALKLLNGDFVAGDTVLVDGDPVSRALRFEKMEIQV